MTDTKSIEAVVVQREYVPIAFSGQSHDSVLLAFQVVAGDGVEKGQVFVELVNRSNAWNILPKVFLLRKGHRFTVPFDKEPEKPYLFLFWKMEIDAQQFAKDPELIGASAAAA